MVQFVLLIRSKPPVLGHLQDFRNIYCKEKAEIAVMNTIYVRNIPGRLKEGIAIRAGRIRQKGNRRKLAATAFFLGAMFLLGRAAAEVYGEAEATAGSTGVMREAGQRLTEQSTGTAGQTAVQQSAGTAGQTAAEQNAGTAGLNPGEVTVILQETENWGLGFGKKAGEKPTGNASVAEMKKYNAYYMAEGDEKVLYLTFDCGYENGNTEPILDALKKHNAPATFFVVGHFLESAPEVAKRMVEDGHTVGNHTYHHYDMSKIADTASFEKEMKDVATLFKEITGSELSMYYRPPQGKYSTGNLKMAQEMGYATFFWSLAYVDWNVDAQPTHEEALKKLTTRVHPGAIVLLHSTSKTNGEIMDELLTKWEEMGYSFKPLSDFAAQGQEAAPTNAIPAELLRTQR